MAGRRAVYVLGRPTGKAVPVAHTWIDVDDDPLVRLLGGPERIESLRLPVVLCPDGTAIEGPEAYHEPLAPPPPHIAADAAYLTRARWRAGVAERLGLATRPTHDVYDLSSSAAGRRG